MAGPAAGYSLFLILNWVVRALIWVIIIDAVLTWFPQIDRRNPLVIALHRITAPIYAPIRKLIPPEKTGYVDVSPLIAIFAIQIIWRIVAGVLFR